MNRFFIVFISIFTLYSTIQSQDKLEFSAGVGLVTSAHDHDDFDTWDGSFLGNQQFSTYSYGFNMFVTYKLKDNVLVRSGIIHMNTRSNHIYSINTYNSFSLPIYLGYRWKFLSLFTGVDAKYTIFSFININETSSIENVPFVKDGYFDVNHFTLDLPISLEMDLSPHSTIGYRYGLTNNLTIKSKDNFDRLKTRYLYINLKF